MTTIQVRDIGTYGFDVTPLTGAGLSTTEAASTRSQMANALALADAIREALASARASGAQAFKPSDSLLVLPAGLSGAANTASRDQLFDQVIGHAYAGGPLDLQEWSQAIASLEHWAGAQASMLPPESGGGSRMVQGTWYVNGLAWSLSELFTVNRVNTLSQIDRLVADSLNVIAANNEATKGLTSLMQAMFSDYYTQTPSSITSKGAVEAMGAKDADHPVSYAQLLAYADKYIGPESMIRKLNDLQPYSAPAYSSTAWYHVGDFARQNGVNYQAIGTNTSSTYSPTAQYHKGDKVYHLGVLYVLDHEQGRDGDNYTMGIEPPDTPEYYWNPVDDYDNGTKYHLDDLVRYNNQYYRLIKEEDIAFWNDYTQGKNPVDNPDFWQLYTDTGTSVLRGQIPPNGTYWAPQTDAGLSVTDFRAMIDEVETLISAFGSDNQVAQLRNETLFNSRSNLLEGLSAFLKGQQTTRSELARNA